LNVILKSRGTIIVDQTKQKVIFLFNIIWIHHRLNKPFAREAWSNKSLPGRNCS
jgi:hypothetical protein